MIANNHPATSSGCEWNQEEDTSSTSPAFAPPGLGGDEEPATQPAVPAETGIQCTVTSDLNRYRDPGDGLHPQRDAGDDVHSKRSSRDTFHPHRSIGDAVHPQRNQGDAVYPHRGPADAVHPHRIPGDALLLPELRKCLIIFRKAKQSPGSSGEGGSKLLSSLVAPSVYSATADYSQVDKKMAPIVPVN
jgi:hypothetical protein